MSKKKTLTEEADPTLTKTESGADESAEPGTEESVVSRRTIVKNVSVAVVATGAAALVPRLAKAIECGNGEGETGGLILQEDGGVLYGDLYLADDEILIQFKTTDGPTGLEISESLGWYGIVQPSW